MTQENDALIGLGWTEWLSLPDLGLPAIKAKVDTGAATSALHAKAIEPFGNDHKPQVRFRILPDPNNENLVITCSAPVVDRRPVTSSNGETEYRYVIETRASFGDFSWPIQVTLTDREQMNYRMLLGREAITEDMWVDPNKEFLQPELSFASYKPKSRKKQTPRPLRIALLSREPHNYSSIRLCDAAVDRGHVIEQIDTLRCHMKLGDHAVEMHYDGKLLPRYDAVIPRIGASITDYGKAVLRQFAAMGTFCLNDAESIGRSSDKLHAYQIFANAGIDLPTTAFARSPKDTKALVRLVGGAPMVVKLLNSTHGRGVVLAETSKAGESLVNAFRGLSANFLVQDFVQEAAGTDIRCLVVGGEVVAAMKRTGPEGDFKSNLHQGGSAEAIKPSRKEISVAKKATKALGLSVAGVDILRANSGPKLLEVNSSPGLEGIERATGINVAEKIIQHLELTCKTGFVGY